MSTSDRKTNPKKMFDPKQKGLAGDIGIAGLLIAALGERIGRGYVLPVFNVGKKLVRKIHPRVWAITGIMMSVLVLLLVVYTALSFLTGGDEPVVEADTITFAEALSSPFDLNDRALLDPNMHINDVLPVSFGDFQRVTNTEEMGSFSRLTSCLTNSGTYQCALEYAPQYNLATYYMDNEGNVIEVMVANYWNDDLATETMDDAVSHARTFSRVGNFVVGAGEIDYFYSTTRNWFSFTWGHGAWVFSISASSPDILENAVQALPY